MSPTTNAFVREGAEVTACAVMIQGTASDAGKSVVVGGLCRAAKRRGIRVAPFKPQNMSNNAAACADGGEIGRAQAVQARAAGLAPRTDFNPVLLKPQTDRGSQVVVHGRPVGMLHASDYRAGRARLMSAHGELRAAGSRVRSGDRGGRRQPGGGQSARRGHRQHGLRAAGGGAGLPGRGHRSRRRHRGGGGDRGRAGRRGPRADRGLPDQQAAGRPGAVRGRRAHHRAAHRVALLRGDSMGAGGAAPAGGGRRVAAGGRPFAGRTGPDSRAGAVASGEL